MEKKKVEYGADVLLSMLAGYGITLAGIVILALLLLFFQISETTVEVGVLVIYALSGLGAGFVIGKRTKRKKFVWGMVSGAGYFLILFLVSLCLHSAGELGNQPVTAAIICMAAGTIGGMIS